MVKLRSHILLFVIILLASACQVNEQAVVLPTLVEFPTETATIASDTPTITATFTPSFTPSDTATSTDTYTPSATFTSTVTATHTVTRTPRATATATSLPTLTPTLTPIPTRTPNAPVIELFDASQLTVPMGDPITLRWIADADTLFLETMDPSGVVLQTVPVDPTGTYTTNVPTSGIAIIYRLIAVRGSEETRAAITVDLGTVCNLNWFFNTLDSTACPASSPRQNPLTFQQFQNGFMFQTTINGSDRVCGIQNDYNVYSCYTVMTYAGTPPATPPVGFLIPSAAFEDAFYNHLATGGFWYDVIGWGISIPSLTSVQIQEGDNGLIYIQLPIGIYAFDRNLTATNGIVTKITQP